MKPASVFTRLLLQWNETVNTRQMPWKGEKDPYKIWLSEIILQQTRVEQGLPYYQRFVTTFPDVHALANAPEDQVMRLWQGLGYYSRARNLHATAKYVSRELKGQFPDTFPELKKLKGVGDYTAAAIASFAYNKPHAVVDGNVVRVLSRVFGMPESYYTAEGKKIFQQAAQNFCDDGSPGLYNQAIMDFGATVCTPQNPLCSTCPVQKICYAFQQDCVGELPAPKPSIRKKERYFNYFIIEYHNKLAVEKRHGRDIWQGLYQFPLLETPKHYQKELKRWVSVHLQQSEIPQPFFTATQQLSHQTIHFRFFLFKVKQVSNTFRQAYQWAGYKELNDLALPKTLHEAVRSLHPTH